MPNLNNTKVPKELEKEICDLYVSGLSPRLIAPRYNCSSANIYNICERNNVARRKQGYKKLTECDENYFNVIDSATKAWLAGVIASDGHVSKNNVLVVRLSSKDIELLEKINKHLKSTYKIQTHNEYDKRTEKTYDLCSLMIYRKQLALDLKKLGIDNNKSKEFKMPDIPKEFIRDFIRGLVCGDGGFCINEGNDITFKLVSSTQNFSEEVQDILIKECDLNKTKIVFDTGCYKFSYSTNSVRKIFHYLYDNVTEDCYLSRKYNYAKRYFDNKDHGIKSRNISDCPVNQYTFGTEDDYSETKPKLEMKTRSISKPKPKPEFKPEPKPRSQLDILLGINK